MKIARLKLSAARYGDTPAGRFAREQLGKAEAELKDLCSRPTVRNLAPIKFT
jgi:hypothetical protein